MTPRTVPTSTSNVVEDEIGALRQVIGEVLDEEPDLARYIAPRRVDGVEPPCSHRMLSQSEDQSLLGNRGQRQIAPQLGKAEASTRRNAKRFGIIDDQPRLDVKPNNRFTLGELPGEDALAWVGSHADTTVSGNLLKRSGQPMRRDVAGRGANQWRDRHEQPGDVIIHGKNAPADGKIETLRHQVDEGVGQRQFYGQLGMHVLEGAKQRQYLVPSERRGRTDPDQPAQVLALVGDRLSRLVKSLQRRRRSRQEPLTFRRQPDLPRCACEQTHAKSVFETLDILTDSGRRYAQCLGGRRKASETGGLHEGLDKAKVHPSQLSRTYMCCQFDSHSDEYRSAVSLAATMENVMPTAQSITAHAPIPRRYAPLLFAGIMSLAMSGLMSAILTALNTGVGPGFVSRWLHAYVVAWALAFPLVTALAPPVRRLVDRLTA